jgi:hypothetical protein
MTEVRKLSELSDDQYGLMLSAVKAAEQEVERVVSHNVATSATLRDWLDLVVTRATYRNASYEEKLAALRAWSARASSSASAVAARNLSATSDSEWLNSESHP